MPNITPSGSAQARAAWKVHSASLAKVRNFELQGRVGSGGLIGVSGDLGWRQQGKEFHLRFSGPFGVGTLLISGTEDDVEIRTRKGSFHTDDPDAFLEAKLGWTLPVKGLRYWVLGLPSPHSSATLELDDEGRAARIEQDGWTLTYTDYTRVDDLELPRRFEMRSGKNRFKVVIETWSELASGRTRTAASAQKL